VSFRAFPHEVGVGVHNDDVTAHIDNNVSQFCPLADGGEMTGELYASRVPLANEDRVEGRSFAEVKLHCLPE
jgi:hypothetical protein